jgi:hypothetical protein
MLPNFRKKRDPKETWFIIIRFLAMPFALAFGYLSIVFSADGFAIRLPDWRWAGWVLAAGVTLLQLIFNRDIEHDPTLFFFGILSYIYGITTNIIGILNIQQVFVLHDENPIVLVFSILFAIAVALFIEVLPERLFLLSLFGDMWFGDPISTIRRGPNFIKSRVLRTNVQHEKPNERTVENVRSSVLLNEQPRSFDPFDHRNIIWPENKNERKIIAAMLEYRKREKDWPSVRDTASKSGVSLSTVHPVWKDMKDGKYFKQQPG